MKVTWVNPCFLDYRVPVYAALDRLVDGGLSIVFSATRIREGVRRKITDVLGDRAVALEGEKRLGIGINEETFANQGISIPYQPGLVRSIIETEPDVIISEGFFQWTPAALWAKRKARVPLVIAYEKTPHTERNAPRLRTLYRRWVASETDAICCNGKLSKEYCTSVLRFDADRIITGAMAADTESLAAKCAALPPEEIVACRLRLRATSGPLFLYVGRLIPLKGLRELLAGWELFTRTNSTGTLVLVGEGPEREPLESIIRDKHVPRVVFAGRAEYEQIASHYAAADCLVMPTLEDNWSLVVPEAMACGKPILCSQFNGCWPELVQPGVNGWVFDPHNAGEIAELLNKCAAEPGRLIAMGRESSRIVEAYSPQHAAEAVLRAIELAADRSLVTSGRGN